MPTIVYSETWDVDDGAPDLQLNSARSTTVARTGAGSIRINPTAAVGYWHKNAAGALTKVVVYRVWARFDTKPAADMLRLLGVFKGGVGEMGVGYKQSSNQFGVFDGSATIANAGGPTVTTGQWYRLDCRVDATANPWKTDVQIDGTALTQTTQAVASSTFADPTYHLGTDSEALTFDLFFDDLSVSHTAADYPFLPATLSWITA